jgi:transposase
VRGLGAPVRFFLTGGQRGDSQQAYALIEGLPAKVVMADAAYDADPLRRAIAAKSAEAIIPTTRPAPANTRSTGTSTPSGT